MRSMEQVYGTDDLSEESLAFSLRTRRSYVLRCRSGFNHTFAQQHTLEKQPGLWEGAR